MKLLRATHIERCIGCHSCSLCCARLVHQMISWSTAGVRIVSSGGLSTGFEAKICLGCDPAPCAKACPTGSFTQRKGGGVKVDKSLCIRCGACAAACPVDAIFLEPESGAPFVCIHCGRCTRFCPHECLELVDSPHGAPTSGQGTAQPQDDAPVPAQDSPQNSGKEASNAN